MVDRPTPVRPHSGADGPWDDEDPTADELPMHLLAAGIPLTLLLDLAENFGPPSAQILEAEHDPAYIDPDDPATDWLDHLSPGHEPADHAANEETEPLPEARIAPDDVRSAIPHAHA